ncbi:MAG: MmgE/PrpD family protein, partial [Pseudomonadota bacterium]
MMNATHILAEHALQFPAPEIPQSAIDRAKNFILDTVGVGVAGCKAPYADEIHTLASAWASDGGARVLGRRTKLSAQAAAYVNGFQIHCQEYDCVHEPAVVHPMATIGAALFAELENSRHPVSGPAFLAAVILSVDVAASLGVATKTPIRFFRPATAGVFGATLGVARLRGFSIERALDALGHALAQCAGTMQAHVEGTPALPIQIAGAARAAINACDLAACDIPGAHDVFEGPYGYFPLFEEDWT